MINPILAVDIPVSSSAMISGGGLSVGVIVVIRGLSVFEFVLVVFEVVVVVVLAFGTIVVVTVVVVVAVVVGGAGVGPGLSSERNIFP